MQLSSRILTALAVLILAVAVVAVRGGSSGTVEAATGTIDVLNVGTCYTTSTDVFGVGDCDDGDTNSEDDGNAGYSVAGRDTIIKADSVFATYAIDPKTSGDQPRAIAKYADVIKISIEDEGRDKRTGKLYAVSGITPTALADTSGTTPVSSAAGKTVIRAIGLDSMAEDGLFEAIPVTTPPTSRSVDNSIIVLSPPAGDTTTLFNNSDGGTSGDITSSGNATFRLEGDNSTAHPMASEDDRGKFYWFGTVDLNNDGTTTDPGDGFQNLTGQYIELDEDQAPGVVDSIAPWMQVTASIPDGAGIQVEYIYYQTSEEEEIIGGKNKDAVTETNPNGYPAAAAAPVFVDKEKSESAALVLNANSDGNVPSQNIWLKEDGRFSGRYEGFLRLTDADGDGKCDDDDDATNADVPCNWGLEAMGASGALMADAANLGVESGPVTITYKNSKGDTKSVTIQIDKDPPAIQIDSPAHDTASKDDSPDLIGSFVDGGGSGLREDSFQIYADNRPDGKTDENPIWDFRVNNASDTAYGYVCVDANEDGSCSDSNEPGTALLRAHYFGYDTVNTFGIIPSEDVYLPEEDPDNAGVDLYKAEGAEDYEDGATSGTFDTVVRIDFDPDPADGNRYNHEIDIQAVVMDVAGNIGFSDSEPNDPTFIHDYGTTASDNKRDAADKHNVIGWYSRHTYFLDDVDPKYVADDSATGFFLDSGGDSMRTSSGLMVVFDGKIDASSVGIGTFEVQLDNGSNGTILDARVKDEKVYLLIEEVLEPDATPKVDLAGGQSIADRAGNESTDRRLDGIELSDGILPTFTVTLSGGTGLNEDVDGEGPSELTKGQMKISISANEEIQGSPKFSVVCSNLTWGANDDNNVAKFASNRTGDFTSAGIAAAAPSSAHTSITPINNDDDDDTRTMCPDHTDTHDGNQAVPQYFDVAVTSALARPGNNWEYQWSELSSDQEVEDGKLSVIVWGRDRSSYKEGADTVYNYSASTASFVYDTDLMAAWEEDDGLVPSKDENVFEVRPFVLLDFPDNETTVDVTVFKIDDVDHTADLVEIEDNDFVWWPEPLSYGTYKVYVEANDAANNQGDYTYSFSVKERAPFVLSLLAGWNSVSFPANPVDRALHAVFTNPAVDRVVGWNVTEPVSPWRLATRVDGVWTTGDEYATLNDVEARYGYWVHSTGFVTQAVPLSGKGDRATDGQPSPADIPTDTGWNFVGVVDVDGDQTQDDAGETLRNSSNDPITAAEYLGNYTRAYTWDHVNNTWDVVKADEGITIGTGVWVYYTKDHDIAP